MYSAEDVSEVKAGEDVLEIGCGLGVFSVLAGLKGAKSVVASDINPDAVRNTEENAALYSLQDKIKVFESDVYDSLPNGLKFNVIFWNTPFFYTEREDLDNLDISVFNYKYESLKRFLVGAKRYLKKNGRVLLEFSKVMGDYLKLKEIMQEANLDYKIIKENKDFYPEIGEVDFILIEARFRS